MSGSRILLFGGSGFIGTWLLAVLNLASEELDIEIEVTSVSRNPSTNFEGTTGTSLFSLRNLSLDLETDSISLGSYFDVIFILSNSNSADPTSKSFSRIRENLSSSLETLRTHSENQPHVIHASSGAIYGRTSNRSGCIPESTRPFPDSGDNYAVEKLALEIHLNRLEESGALHAASPRIFSTYGPGLPIDKHFAIGNFIQSKLSGKPISILGHPETRRSYLYISDLIVYLLKISEKPINLPLNLGSPESISILDLAKRCAAGGYAKNIEISLPSTQSNKTTYFPCVERLTSNYGNEFTINLESGLERWAQWLNTQ
jgi:nucleoside-diphosphate-sugar epimerase